MIYLACWGEGYSDGEIALFGKILHRDEHLLYKYAENEMFKKNKV